MWPFKKKIKPAEFENPKPGCFEFLITGDIDLSFDWDEVMTPNNFLWSKLERNGWHYYVVDGDEICYSVEPPGIQMVFNKEMPFEKAKLIADDVMSNIKLTGQDAELSILRTDIIYGF